MMMIDDSLFTCSLDATEYSLVDENPGPFDLIRSIDELGIDGDFIESQAFAYLAIRSYLKLPISFPDTTGVSKSCTGGVIIKNY